MADITTYVEQLSARVNLADIFIGQRRRKDYGNIEELAKDFRDNGQITAITLRPPNEEDKSDPEYKGQTWALVAGGRRIAAATHLNWTSIRAVDREHMDPLKHRVLELAENLARKDMSFVEIVQAKQEMFLLRKEQNPEITQAEVAKEIGETAANFSRDLRVAEVIEQRPELKQASSKKAVIRQAVMAEHFEARALRDEVTGNNYMIQLADRLKTMDARDWLMTLPEQFADLCIPDLPYGIDHFSQGHKTDAGEGGISEFDDSEGVSLDLFTDLVPKMIRATKQSGWIICFMSEANYEFLKNLFHQCCRKHYEYFDQHEGSEDCDYGKVEEPRWIWYRPNSNNNPRFPEIHAKNLYEHILVFNRGNGKLLRPCGNLLPYDAEYGNRIHATQKPLELLKDIISRVTLPGETVIDPCFGSGAHLAAGAALARDIYGCDTNEAIRGPALGYVSQFYQGVAPKARDNGTSDFLDSRLADPDSEAGDEPPDEIDMEALRELQAETDAAMRGS